MTAPFDLNKFKSKRGHLIRNGKRIEVETLEPKKARKKRKPFKIEFVKLPTSWVECLKQARRITTIHLAHCILLEAFKREHLGGDIVLSAKVTGMFRSVRYRATRELVELGLIEVEQFGSKAPRIVRLVAEAKNANTRRRQHASRVAQKAQGANDPLDEARLLLNPTVTGRRR